MMTAEAAPEKQKKQNPRSCAACRAEAPKAVLLRVVRTPSGDAVFDPTGKLPGRGAYLCPDVKCLESARKSGALGRALKTAISGECWEGLRRGIEAVNAGFRDARGNVEEDICHLLGMSRRAGLLVIGRDAIQARAASKKAPLLVMTARGASEATLGFAKGLAEAERERKHGHAHLPLPLDNERMSEAIGCGNVQIAAIPARGGMAVRLLGLCRGEKQEEGRHAIEQ